MPKQENQTNNISIEIKNNEKTSTLTVKLLIPSLYLNWKPETIAKFMDFVFKNLSDQNENANLFMYSLETPLSDREPTENTQKSFKFLSKLKKTDPNYRAATSLEMRKDSSTLNSIKSQKNFETSFTKLQLDIEINRISLLMVTYPYFTLGKILGECLNLSIFLKTSSIEVSGSMDSLRLMDVTGYPVTDCTYKRGGENDYELLNSKSKKILDFKMIFIDDDCFLEDKIYNYININFDGLILNYVQQPVLRMIDYLNEKILGVLTEDYKTPEKIKLHPRRLKQIVKDPRFTELKIKLKNSEINLMILPLVDEKLKVSIKDIIIENYSEKDYGRFEKENESGQDFIFTDVININLKGISLNKQEEGYEKLKSISNDFDIEISISRVLNSIEVMHFFANLVKLDDGIKIKMKTNLLKLYWQKTEYLHLMKIVFNNLSYDDGYDNLIYKANLNSSQDVVKTCSNN